MWKKKSLLRKSNFTCIFWLIHVNVWQKPLQYCKVISLQLIKMNEKKKKEKVTLCYDKWKVSH